MRFQLASREFSVYFVSDAVVRGAMFRRVEREWQLLRAAEVPVDAENPAAAWKRCFKEIGKVDGVTLLTGALKDGIFFRFDSVPLSMRDQCNAVEMELPRRLPFMPEERLFQFAAAAPEAEGKCAVGVYLIPAASVNPVVARMTQGAVRADELIYPLLALEKEDPPLWLPEIEPDFYFDGQSWQPVAGAEKIVAEGEAQFREHLKSWCDLRTGLDGNFSSWIPLLLVGRMAASGAFAANRGGLELLPEKLRPMRFRRHLMVTALLAVLLVINLLWSFSRGWGADYRRYQELERECRKLKREISIAKSQSRKNNRELKEMSRVLTQASGEAELIPKLALLSNALPGNVLVSSLRWNDSGVEVVMQCEDDKLDLPAVINPLGLWKIGQLHQRQNGDSSVATIVLKLVPIDQEEVKK